MALIFVLNCSCSRIFFNKIFTNIYTCTSPAPFKKTFGCFTQSRLVSTEPQDQDLGHNPVQVGELMESPLAALE